MINKWSRIVAHIIDMQLIHICLITVRIGAHYEEKDVF